MLPAETPARVNVDAIEDLFGGTDMVMLVVESDDLLAAETLSRVRKLSRKVERIKALQGPGGRLPKSSSKYFPHHCQRTLLCSLHP